MRTKDNNSRPRANSFVRQLFTCLLFLALPAAGAAHKHGAADQSPPAAIVHMTVGNKFEPEKVTIKSGEAVRWINDSGGPSHTVTTDPTAVQNEDDVAIPDGAKPFSSGVIGPGKFFQHAFDVPGTYRYACAPHEGSKMFGEVVVTK